jgi:hypothetical protein
MLGAARGVGEAEVARAALRRMEATCGTGQRWPERPLHAGVQTLGIHLLTRWGTPLGSAALALRGYVRPDGPILIEGPGDEAIVTKARCDDGVTLSLALQPRRAASASVSLRFGALLPQRRYRLAVGEASYELTSGADGRAAVDVAVTGRVEASLRPAEDETSR